MMLPSPFSAVWFLLLTTASVLATQPYTVCPQVVPNDPSPVFCATNAYGTFQVRRSQFENWNCIHPYAKYTIKTLVGCDPEELPIPTCDPETCDNEGETVCARLMRIDPRKSRDFTTAVFGNQCQLTLYNCKNPTRRFIELNTTMNKLCKSPGFQ